MKTYRVHFVIDVPCLFSVDVIANGREQAEAVARESPWESGGRVLHTEWEGGTDTLEFDWESTRPLELIPERGDGGIEEIQNDRTIVTMLVETTGENHKGEELTFPVGSLGYIASVENDARTGRRTTIVIEGEIVNVFDDDDGPGPFWSVVVDRTPPQQHFTVFCRQTDRRGTTWIGAVVAPNLEAAESAGRKACAADWGWENRDPDDIYVIGVVSGDVKVELWNDDN